MTPYEHSVLHARDFGGQPEDYIKVDEFLDQTKGHYADFRHRMILHNSLGMLLAEQVLGPALKNSEGMPISVREIARRHIIQDLGFVPTVKQWCDALNTESWMNSPKPIKATGYGKLDREFFENLDPSKR